MEMRSEESNHEGRLLPWDLKATFRLHSITNAQTLTIRLWGGLVLLGLLLLAL